MYKNILIKIIIIFLTFFNHSYSNELKKTEDISYFYKNIFQQLLKEDIDFKRDAYDFSHFLMIPMNYAYLSQNESYIKYYDIFFYRVYSEFSEVRKLGRLTKLQFLYFTSYYLLLNKIIGKKLNKWQKKLLELVQEETKKIYFAPAWQWSICGTDKFWTNKFSNMRDRFKWKLTHRDVKKSYCRAIIDEELFIIGISANLKSLDLNQKFIEEVLNIAFEIFSNEISWKKEYWYFQSEVWKEHSEFRYACYENELPKKPKLCDDISLDTSHFHRMPLLLLSLQLSARNEKEKNFYKKLRIHLGKLFIEKIIVFPNTKYPFYRTKNYMNGRNGFFRVGYSTTKSGYGPYQLSLTFLLGWWSLLPEKEINEIYCDIYSSIPFDKKVIDYYLSVDTNRQRHQLIKGRNKFLFGIIYLDIGSACLLKEYKHLLENIKN